jgi:hypothetical protein
MLEGRLAGHRAAIIWPEKPADIPDKDPCFLVAYLPLEFGGKPRAEQEVLARELLEKYGDKPRKYRNGVGLAVPAAGQIEILRRSVRYLLAIEQVKAKAKQLNLTDEQKSQLREREATEKAAAEAALLRFYLEVWFPRVEGTGIGMEVVSVGGRPLQTTLNEKKEAAIHERVMELITQVQRCLHVTLTPGKVIELFKLGEGMPPSLGIKTADLVEGFYSFLGFTRLVKEEVVSKAIVKGVQEGAFGYVAGGAPSLGPDGKYQVSLSKVRFNMGVAEDEIDLETGFLMMPQAIPLAVEPPGRELPAPGTGETPGTGKVAEGLPTSPKPASEQKVVELTFSADRNQLFTAWNAAANLADMAGKVTVTLHAESEQGFDRTKLQNGVLEPLKEADLIP